MSPGALNHNTTDILIGLQHQHVGVDDAATSFPILHALKFMHECHRTSLSSCIPETRSSKHILSLVLHCRPPWSLLLIDLQGPAWSDFLLLLLKVGANHSRALGKQSSEERRCKQEGVSMHMLLLLAVCSSAHAHQINATPAWSHNAVHSLQVPEHTWGSDVKYTLHDIENYTGPGFLACVNAR